VKVAVIGLGAMGRRLSEAVRRVEGLTLAAVAERREEALAAFEGEGVARFQRAEELFDTVEVDLAVVSTTAPGHHPLVMQAMEAGVRRILCEKPMACSVAQAREMVEEARRRGVRLAVNHNKRAIPLYGWLRGNLTSGAWGGITGIGTTCRGAGLGCLGVHFFDQIRFFTGDAIVRVTGWLDPELRENPRGAQFHDPGGLVVMEGRSGARYLHRQMEASAGPEHILIDTSLLRIRIEEMFREVEVIRRDFSVRPGPGRPPKFDRLNPPEGVAFTTDVVALSAALLRNLAGDEPLIADARDGLASLEVVVAAHLSHRRGNVPAALPLTDPADLALELPIT